MEPIEIFIKQEHIAKGICGHPTKCPIALAVEGAKLPLVSKRIIRIMGRWYKTPEDMANWIENFDNFRFDPTTEGVTVPQPAIFLITEECD